MANDMDIPMHLNDTMIYKQFTTAERKVLMEIVKREAPEILQPSAVKRIIRDVWETITRRFNTSASCKTPRSTQQVKRYLTSIVHKNMQRKGGGRLQGILVGRKSNFTKYERILLLRLARNNMVIFSKHKDSETQIEKRKGWSSMMWTFNKSNGIEYTRTAREIKTCVMNMIGRSIEEFVVEFKKYIAEYQEAEGPRPAKTTTNGKQADANLHRTMFAPILPKQPTARTSASTSQQSFVEQFPMVPQMSYRAIRPKPDTTLLPMSVPSSMMPPVLLAPVAHNTPVPSAMQPNPINMPHPVRVQAAAFPQAPTMNRRMRSPVSIKPRVNTVAQALQQVRQVPRQQGPTVPVPHPALQSPHAPAQNLMHMSSPDTIPPAVDPSASTPG